MARTFLLLFSALLFSTFSFAQLRELPVEVKEAFMAQYPDAESPEYKDNLVNVQVAFSINGEKMLATYNNKGMWRNTEKDWSFEQLEEDVKEGFKKSKYAGEDWKVTDTKIVYVPGNKEKYRVKVEKNDIQKKYLYFNKTGRLISESITI